MKKLKSIFLCALGSLSLVSYNSTAKGKNFVKAEENVDNAANVLNENA